MVKSHPVREKRTLKRKLRYAKAIKQNKNIPRFVLMKKSQTQRWNNQRHNWRRSHLKL